jgi:hypothetical protein
LVAYKNMISLAADLVSNAAYAEMTEQVSEIGTPEPENQANSQGIGFRQIIKVLGDVPGIGKSKVEEQLANLKASGHYARIINEVAARVEAEAAKERQGSRTDLEHSGQLVLGEFAQLDQRPLQWLAFTTQER